VSSARDENALSETLRRWLNENVADTRAKSGPEGRVYAAPFAQVWDAILQQVASRRGWVLAHKDEEMGIITVRCRTPVFRFVDDLTIWVALDENGQTLVDALSRSRVGKGDLGVNGRRIRRVLSTLDQALGPNARLRPYRARAEASASTR
jgi:hypothetical protein